MNRACQYHSLVEVAHPIRWPRKSCYAYVVHMLPLSISLSQHHENISTPTHNIQYWNYTPFNGHKNFI